MGLSEHLPAKSHLEPEENAPKVRSQSEDIVSSSASPSESGHGTRRRHGANGRYTHAETAAEQADVKQTQQEIEQQGIKIEIDAAVTTKKTSLGNTPHSTML